MLPLQNLSPHAEILEQRAIGLWRLATQRVPITIMPVASALLRIAPGEYYRQLALKLRIGDELPLDDVVAHLESIGYERREPVEMVGEYSVRGGILDVFSPEAAKPVRVDLFGDLVESIRRFEVESQRSVLKIEECTLLPLTEYQKSRELLAELGELVGVSGPPGEPFPGWELLAGMVRPLDVSVFSLLENPIVLWDEPEQVHSAAERFWKRLEQIERSEAYDPAKIFFSWDDLKRQAGSAPAARYQGTGDRLERPVQLSRFHAAVAGVPRQYAGGHRRGAQPGGSGKSRGLFRIAPPARWSAWPTSSTSTASPISLGSSRASPRRRTWPSARTWPARWPASTSSRVCIRRGTAFQRCGPGGLRLGGSV